MSAQEGDLVNNSTDTEKSSSYDLPESLREKLQHIPEAIKLIELLQKQIKKQKKRLKKLKAKLKKRFKDIGTQTDFLGSKENQEPKNLVDEIKEAAELATKESGFLYDETSGLYYDSNSGYYYNAEYGLYYDPRTGTYMSYNERTKSYSFHSQVQRPETEYTKDKISAKRKHHKDESKVNNRSTDLEQITSCFNSLSINIKNLRTLATDLSKQWPPCMRIIVEQSMNPKIKIGSLHIVTYEGGTVGREGTTHSILLPDRNISKVHLKFTFDKENNYFMVVDMGSRNGTILNGKRMAVSKQESESFKVDHGSRIQLGSLILLCHIHEGNQTCGHCEPGLIQSDEKEAQPVSRLTKSDLHKHELKQLRKKFGINQYEAENTKLGKGYTDRAQQRRETVGSQNPHEKTESASLEQSIPSENKGFKMLSKMGWKEGESLGKDNQGLVEPIPLISNPGTSGMGSTEPQLVENKQSDKNKQIVWKKTQERFKLLPTVTNIFNEEESD